MKKVCWIYKRALFYEHGKDQPVVVDYSDGTIPFLCDADVQENGKMFHVWYLHDNVLKIPLNVKRTANESFFSSGILPVENGEIHWEFLYGKCRGVVEHYLEKFLQLSPLLVLLVLLYISRRRRI